ncbi:MAG: glycosyl transferase family 2 [Gemmatimonadetes bacterium]|nr:glycosyl transferase family 2 [Gemmatimonadota bacterium]
MTDISLIIPFLNEEENIPTLAATLDQYFASLKDLKCEVLFVDDGSSDASVDLLARAPHEAYRAKVISLSRNYGSHAALRAGMLHAEGRRITFLSADLQDPVELIEQLYVEAEKGYDIVWAMREQVDTGLFERMFSSAYGSLMRRFALSEYPQKGFDVVMFNKKVQAELNQRIEAHSSLFLQILSIGFRSSSISYHKQARKVGKSKWTLSKKVKLLIDSFVAFSYAPIRFVSVSGIVLALGGFSWASYIVFRHFLFRDLDPGWPALVSILMMGFGVTNISLGIIAEYLWRTLDSSRRREVFIVNEILQLSGDSAAAV